MARFVCLVAQCTAIVERRDKKKECSQLLTNAHRITAEEKEQHIYAIIEIRFQY